MNSKRMDTILRILSDGESRTSGQIATHMSVPVKDIANSLNALHRNGDLDRERKMNGLQPYFKWSLARPCIRSQVIKMRWVA